LQSQVEKLTGFLTQAIEDAAPLHEFEEKTFRVLLGLGCTCLKILVNALGTVDVEEAAILVHTADGKGQPIRRPSETPLIESDRSNSGAQPNRKKMAVQGAVYSIELHLPTPEDVTESRFRHPDQPGKKMTRPRPQHKRLHANWDHIAVPGDSVHGSAATCGWIAEEVASRKPHSTKPVVAIMDGQESLWNQHDVFADDVEMIDVLDLLHVTLRLWAAAELFHSTESREAKQFDRERVLQSEVALGIRGSRQMSTTHGLCGKRLKRLEVICT